MFRTSRAERCGIAAAIILAATGPSEATPSADVSLGREESFYGRLDAGALFIDRLGFSASERVRGVSVDADGALRFRTGTAVSAALGHRVTRHVALELEGGYMRARFDTVEGTVTVTSSSGAFTVPGSAKVDGKVEAGSALLNVVVTPFPDGRFQPHVGSGLGAAAVQTKIKRVGPLSVDASEEGVTVIAAVTTGFEYAVSPKARLGVRYRFFWMHTGDNELDDVTGHTVTANLRIPF